jgi:hypothetical protein
MKKIKLNVCDFWSGRLIEGMKGKLIGFENYGEEFELYVLRLVDDGSIVVVKRSEVCVKL